MTGKPNIYAALAKAQAEMEPALKKADNPHFRKKYADLGAVQDACLPALRKHGFAVFQPVGRDDHGSFVRTVLAHESGETLDCLVPLLVGKNDMQGLGSAITYARRYGLLCMSGVAPEDDDGHAAVQRPPKPAQPRGPMADDPSIANEPEPKRWRADDDLDGWAKALIGGSMSLAGLEVSRKLVKQKFAEAKRKIPDELKRLDAEVYQKLAALDPQAPHPEDRKGTEAA